MDQQATTTKNQPASEWPGPFGIYKRAASAVRQNMWTLLGLIATSILASAVLSSFDRTNIRWVAQLAGYLVGILLQLALIAVYLAGGRNKTMDFASSLKRAASRFVDGFIAVLLSGFLVVLSFVALIIPGLFVVPRLVLVPYFVMDKDLGPVDAIKASWRATKGHSLKAWGVIAVSILFGVLILLLVGIYLSFMYQTAFALLYLYVTGQSGALASATPDPSDTPAAAA